MNGNTKPHFILVPLVAQGHMIPAVDLARLLADRGASVTVITTPINAARIAPVISRIQSSSLPIRFVELPFPATEAGLPSGCENLDMVPTHLYVPFFRSLRLLIAPLELHLRKTDLRSAVIISDSCNYWTSSVAKTFGLPRLLFHGPSCFYLLSSLKISHLRIESDHFLVPGIPHKISVTRAQAPGSWFCAPGFEEIRERVDESEAAADGVVVNTFSDLEHEFLSLYRDAIGKPVLPVGPVNLCNKDVESKSTRGNTSVIDERSILLWLDGQDKKSVIYVNFGSIIRTCRSQLIEIGNGLEATRRPYVWAIRSGEEFEWATETGLVIRGWAPQTLILAHPSVGGFVTHCGWNSVLEAVAEGVPMLTWPHIADQFLNGKLAVEVLGVGVDIGVTEPRFSLDGEDEVWVKREVIERGVERLMDGGEEGMRRRERARVLGEKARLAMEEGGSSYKNLDFLVESFAKGI